MVWYLLEILEKRKSSPPAELNDILMRMFASSKIGLTDLPVAVKVLTFVQGLDKKMPGFEAAYNSLIEYAHPNWRGVSGLYSKIDHENFTVHYGRGLRDLGTNEMVDALVGGLLTFQTGYGEIADVLPSFLAELEKL